MIDTSVYNYSDSRLKDLYKHLKLSGFDVYMPGVKYGDCKAPYVEVKSYGLVNVPGTSSKSSLYIVMCYVPKKSYSELEKLVEDVKKAMYEIKPMFIESGIETPSFYDDSIKAHMISIQYRNSRKMC